MIADRNTHDSNVSLNSAAELMSCWTGQIEALWKLRLLLWNEGQALVGALLSVQLHN